jgi:hypothetical protein
VLGALKSHFFGIRFAYEEKMGEMCHRVRRFESLILLGSN